MWFVTMWFVTMWFAQSRRSCLAFFRARYDAVGDAVTLADIIGATAMEVVYMCLMAPADWAAVPATLRWLTTVYGQPQYLDSVGVVPPCEKVMVYDPAGPQVGLALFATLLFCTQNTVQLMTPSRVQCNQSDTRE
jgi:hypothetical protein